MYNQTNPQQNQTPNIDLDRQVIAPYEQDLLFQCRTFPLRHNHKGFGWVKPFSYTLVIALVVVVMIFAMMNRPEILPFIMVPVFVIFLVFVIKTRQIDMMKKLTQYFRDENGVFYRVIFTQGASMTVYKSYDPGSGSMNYLNAAIRKAKVVEQNVQQAQEAWPAFYYVQRHKQGIRDWNSMSGGPAKVARLDNLRLVACGNKKSTFECDINGKHKKLRILNAYEGLADAVSMY